MQRAHSVRKNQYDRRSSNLPRAYSTPNPGPSDMTPYHEREISLLTNAYYISTAKKSFRIYEYELVIQPSPTCRGIPPEVMARAYVSRSIRQLIMRDIIPYLLNSTSILGRVVIGPNLEAVCSTLPLFNHDTTEVYSQSSQDPSVYRLENVTVPTYLISHLKVDIELKYSKTFDSIPSEYNGFLHSAILHHQLLIDMMKYGSVYYSVIDDDSSPSERLDLISKHLMGVSISGARRSIEDKAFVIINCSHSYITITYPLINLLDLYLSGRFMDAVEARAEIINSAPFIDNLSSLRHDHRAFTAFCDILAGFKCSVIDSNRSAVNLRFSVTDKPADELLLDEFITVADYYRNMGIQIKYPNLPCLKSRSLDHPYYPLEMCALLPGQKVPIFRLNPAARSHLITMNKPKPDRSRATSSKARDDLSLINREQFRSFGVALSKDPIETFGWTLRKPLLQYRNQIIDPPRDYWESGVFYRAKSLVDNWCVVDTVGIDSDRLMSFLRQFSEYSSKYGVIIGAPLRITKPKQDILNEPDSIESLIRSCSRMTKRDLRLIVFIIDSTSTQLNRLIHIAFDDYPGVTATCLRLESVLNQRQQRSIYRTFVHKLNTRLGGTNYLYDKETWGQLSLDSSEFMIIGLDVTHPDNELNGCSIVGCAYTFSSDLFRHKSLVWPQQARKEIITKMDSLMERLLNDFKHENSGQLPRQIIIYRDGVSNEEFERVRSHEIFRALQVIESIREEHQDKPNLSYIIAQKRHTMRFFQKTEHEISVQNPPGGTLVDHEAVTQNDREFYLFSNISPQATARPLHYHVLHNGLGMGNLQKLTYYLCFNFGRCSSSLSMPSSLRYAHNAAYDARNRVIASKDFSENQFYSSKFFC